MPPLVLFGRNDKRQFVLEDAWRAYWYGQYGERIEQWRQCCPELQERVKNSGRKRDVEALKTIIFPAGFFDHFLYERGWVE